MQVLVLTPGFVAEDGPACVPALIDLLTNLKARHSLDVHAIIPPPSVRGKIQRRGIELRAYGNRPRAARLVDLLAHLAARPSYDLVWSLWIDRSGWAGVLASRILRRPLLLSVMARELADRSQRRFALRTMAFAARRITVGSRALMERMASIAPESRERIRCAPLGIPHLEQRKQRTSRGGVRSIAVTTLQSAKQPSLLLRAIAELAAGGRDPTLDVYGYATPAEVDRFLREARDLGVAARVHHRGFVEPDQLRARYRDYDLLLHASAYESQGMALIEAAASDLPVACFDVGVARELLELGAAISIAKDDLAAAAVRALDAPPIRAGDRVLARFSIARTTADFEAVLDEAAA